MPTNNTEKRQQTRRSLRMPVTFFSNEKKGSLSDYFFGWTKDVSLDGVCIHAKLNHIPNADSPLTLLVGTETQDKESNSDVSVQIKGRVIWNDKKNQSFGVRFL